MPSASKTTASDEAESLAQWRKSIDSIDNNILTLLAKRAHISQQISATKPGQSLRLRPDRESQLMEKLLGAVDQPLNRDVIIAIWRQILAHSTGLQSDVHPFVVQPPNDHTLMRWAWEYFGAQADLQNLSQSDALQMLRDDQFAIGAFALDMQSNWWEYLPDDVSVCAALPWMRDQKPQALLVARLMQAFDFDIAVVATTKSQMQAVEPDRVCLCAHDDAMLVALPATKVPKDCDYGRVIGGFNINSPAQD